MLYCVTSCRLKTSSIDLNIGWVEGQHLINVLVCKLETVRVYAFMCVCGYVCMYMYVFRCVCGYVCIYVCGYVCMYLCVFEDMCLFAEE